MDYKIGEFSNLTGLSIKTLRYYDEINLLKPSRIDLYTNYRYYTNKELETFKKIEYLKKVGFTLVEIKNILDKNITVEIIDNKIKDLSEKRDYLDIQIKELVSLKNNTNYKVKRLTKN